MSWFELVTLLWFLFTRFKVISCNFECRVHYSERTGTDYNNQREVSCSPEYPTMVSCGCRTYLSQDDNINGCAPNKVNGEWICRGHNGAGGDGMYAIARCCKFPTNDVECVGLDTTFISGDDAVISATCGQSSYQYLTGCSAYSPNDAIDGMYPNPDIDGYNGNMDPFAVNPIPHSNYKMNGYCSANSGAAGGQTNAQLTCCDSPTYPLDCHIRYGEKVAGSATSSAISESSCDAGYTLTGCSGYSTYRNINAWFIEYLTEICSARTDNDKPVQSVAICCRIATNAPSTDPTTDPTKYPTPAPTIYPTPSPTHYPTKDPIIYPTYNPTGNPSKFGQIGVGASDVGSIDGSIVGSNVGSIDGSIDGSDVGYIVGSNVNKHGFQCNCQSVNIAENEFAVYIAVISILLNIFLIINKLTSNYKKSNYENVKMYSSEKMLFRTC